MQHCCWSLHALPVSRDSLNFGKVPFLITQWTNGTRLQPPLDTIQMEYMSTIPKGDAQSIVVGRCWIGLIFDAGFIQWITTYGALTYDYVSHRWNKRQNGEKENKNTLRRRVTCGKAYIVMTWHSKRIFRRFNCHYHHDNTNRMHVCILV